MSRDTEARISSGYLAISLVAAIKYQVLVSKYIKIFLSSGVGVIKAARF
jgi:hypothetical protein